MKDPSTRKALVLGWILLAFSLPLGITLETLHAFKVPAYLESDLRRDLWTLAHAHGNLLAILCLAFAALAERALTDERSRRRTSLWLRVGAVLLPLGFLLGGVLNSEGDPSLGILLVPAGGACLAAAVVLAGIGYRRGG